MQWLHLDPADCSADQHRAALVEIGKIQNWLDSCRGSFLRAIDAGANDVLAASDALLGLRTLEPEAGTRIHKRGSQVGAEAIAMVFVEPVTPEHDLECGVVLQEGSQQVSLAPCSPLHEPGFGVVKVPKHIMDVHLDSGCEQRQHLKEQVVHVAPRLGHMGGINEQHIVIGERRKDRGINVLYGLVDQNEIAGLLGAQQFRQTSWVRIDRRDVHRWNPTVAHIEGEERRESRPDLDVPVWCKRLEHCCGEQAIAIGVGAIVVVVTKPDDRVVLPREIAGEGVEDFEGSELLVDAKVDTGKSVASREDCVSSVLQIGRAGIWRIEVTGTGSPHLNDAADRIGNAVPLGIDPCSQASFHARMVPASSAGSKYSPDEPSPGGQIVALVAGVDSSTQSTKVEIRDTETGALVASAKAPHPPTTPPVSEQDPNDWWGALAACFAQLDAAVLRDVTGLSIAGQQHGLVVVDPRGDVIRPAKLWNDTTSAPQAASLTDELGPLAWANRCGLVPVASFTITKLRWLAENEPDNFAKVAMVMLPHDWLTWWLTGNHVTDRGDASGTGWWSGAVGYRTDLLDLVVANGDDWVPKLPRVLGPNEAAGTLRPAIADVLGLSASVIVGPGTGDNMGAALGLGLRPGDVAVSLGTSGTAYAVSNKPVADATGSVAGFADATGNYLPLVATLNATKVTDTVASWLGTDAQGLAAAALAGDACAHPILLPYFDGERTPNLPTATGRFVELRNDVTREQLARAAHQGVACGLLDGVDAIAAADVAIGSTLRLIGGGARSRAYQQVFADLWGSPIHVHAEGELVATGACVQAAAVATGSSVDKITEGWAADAEDIVEPTAGVDGRAIRSAYEAASSAYAEACIADPDAQ